MLSELTDLQESDEDVFAVDFSISVTTRSEDESELVEKTYTFDHAPEWDEWTVIEFEEKRCPIVDGVIRRDWRTSEHILWHEGEEIEKDIPPEVNEELERIFQMGDVSFDL